MHKKKTCTNNRSHQCFLRNVKRVKKKQSECKSCLAIKRCVFKVRSTVKKEMLQTRTLLSERTLQITLNDELDRPCPLNLKNYSTTFGAIETSFSSKVYENTTVH